MSAILSSLRNTVIVSAILAVIVLLAITSAGSQTSTFEMPFVLYVLRYLHVVSGIMWIGLLWYFNFVQIPNMPKIPDEQKPAIGKVIAPAALFWFRWGAMATLITGLLIAILAGWGHQAFMLQPGFQFIGVGMYLAIIMWFNVWFVIWPNQKKALGIVTVEADVKAKAARTAMLFSRTNTMLSLPMLLCMVAQSHIA